MLLRGSGPDEAKTVDSGVKFGLADRQRVITHWRVKKYMYTKYSNHGVFLYTYSIHYCVADGRKPSKLTACKSPGSDIQKIREMVLYDVRQSIPSCHCFKKKKR